MPLLNLTELLPRYAKKSGRGRRFPEAFFGPPPPDQAAVLDQITMFGVYAYAGAAGAAGVGDADADAVPEPEPVVEAPVKVVDAVQDAPELELHSPDPLPFPFPEDRAPSMSILSELSSPAPSSPLRSRSRSHVEVDAMERDPSPPRAATQYTQPRPPPPLRHVGSSSPASPIPVRPVRPRRAPAKFKFTAFRGYTPQDEEGGDTDPDELSDYERNRREQLRQRNDVPVPQTQVQVPSQTQMDRTDTSLPQSQDSFVGLARYSTAHDMENEEESVRLDPLPKPIATAIAEDEREQVQENVDTSEEHSRSGVLVPTTTDESDPRNTTNKTTQSSPAHPQLPPSSGAPPAPATRKRPRTSTATNASADADDEGPKRRKVDSASVPREREGAGPEVQARTPLQPYSSEITEPSPDYRRDLPAPTARTVTPPRQPPSPVPPNSTRGKSRASEALTPTRPHRQSATPAHRPPVAKLDGWKPDLSVRGLPAQMVAKLGRDVLAARAKLDAHKKKA